MTQLASDTTGTRSPKRTSKGEPTAGKSGADQNEAAQNGSARGQTGQDERQRAAEAAPSGSDDAATEAVMGLDMLLVDAAQGPLRRLIPPAGTVLRFGSSLVRKPGTVAGRAG